MQFESRAGPVEWVQVRVAGGRALRVARPRSPDALLDDARVIAWNREHNYMPYWAYLWPGAFLLARAVGARTWTPGTRALEIGCGLGLAGLAGVASGLHVRFTDYEVTALSFVEQSARANGFSPEQYSTGAMDWREPGQARYPVVLGADVTYERSLVPLVAGLLATVLEPTGVALIASPQRSAGESFPDALRDAGLLFRSQAIEAEDDRGQRVRGTLFEVTRVRGAGASY